MDIAIVGAGSVGRALGSAFAGLGHTVTYGVRDPDDVRHATLGRVASVDGVTNDAELVVLAVPADAVPGLVGALRLQAGQSVIDATNAVRIAVPDGHATMGDLVASLVPAGVSVAKAFNTVGAEHLVARDDAGPAVFLPIAGDQQATDIAASLARALGFECVVLGGRDRFAMVEDHARLWIHLAFGCGWGRDFAFTAVRG